MKKIAAILIACTFGTQVYAQVVMTEIMYDAAGTDTGREWVEVQNTGAASIDLTTWKFFEANVNHGIDQVDGYAKELLAGEFGVVISDKAKFLLDYPSFAGKLFKSSFSLTNTIGEALAFKDETSVVRDQFTYDVTAGAAGDGNTLQKNGSLWVAALANPGFPFSSAGSGGSGGGGTGTTTATTTAITTPPTGGSGGGTGTTTPPTSTSTTPIVYGSGSVYALPQLYGTITSPQITLAGVDTLFQGKAYVTGGKEINYAQYGWNYGDGTIGNGASTTKRYKYPGLYAMTMDASASIGNNNTTSIEYGSITVIAPDIRIEEGRDEEGNGYMLVTNKTSYRVDVSSWIIRRGGSDGERYQFPKNTFIMPFTSVRISDEAAQFRYDGPLQRSELQFSNGKTVAMYDPLGSAPLAFAVANRGASLPSSVETKITTRFQVQSSSVPQFGGVPVLASSIGGFPVPTVNSTFVAQVPPQEKIVEKEIEPIVLPQYITRANQVSKVIESSTSSSSVATTSTTTRNTLIAAIGDKKTTDMTTILKYSIPGLFALGALGYVFGRKPKQETEYTIIDDSKK